jgi:hypothetical protein
MLVGNEEVLLYEKIKGIISQVKQTTFLVIQFYEDFLSFIAICTRLMVVAG